MEITPKTLDDYLTVLSADAGVQQMLIEQLRLGDKGVRLVERMQAGSFSPEVVDENTYGIDYERLTESIEHYLETSISSSKFLKNGPNKNDVIELSNYKDLIYWVLDPNGGWLQYFDSYNHAIQFITDENSKTMP